MTAIRPGWSSGFKSLFSFSASLPSKEIRNTKIINSFNKFKEFKSEKEFNTRARKQYGNSVSMNKMNKNFLKHNET